MENRLRIEEDSNSKKAEAYKKLEELRIKFFRLALRLGIQNPNNNVIVSQVLQRLVLLPSSSDDDDQQQLQLWGGIRNEGPRRLPNAGFSFHSEHAIATEQLAASEEEEEEEAGCTILVIGKTGVGKSATINSIFDDDDNNEVKCVTDPFQLGTKKVRDVVGSVGGIKLRIIDTPGLVPTGCCSWSDQRRNEKTLHSIKRFIRKTHPLVDIVLYVDRLDIPIRNDEFGDIPLLRTITKILGSWVWLRTVVVLTHAESASAASNYDMFVTQRSHVVQKSICEAVGMMQMMNPIVLAENNSRCCRKNSIGQRVLPNDQVWVPRLLLLSFASMIMDESNATLLKLQVAANTSTTGFSLGRKLFGTRLATAPPLNFLLSSLFQSLNKHRPDYVDDDNYSSDSDSDGDELPPIKVLRKVQIAKLTTVQKKAYFDELKYREKLFLKKQYYSKGKKKGENIDLYYILTDDYLPISFDSQQPTYLYHFPSDTSRYWLTKRCGPSLLPRDHDFGYDSCYIGRSFEVKDSIPVSFRATFLKDKNHFQALIDLASTVKHRNGKATCLDFNMRTYKNNYFYATLISNTRLINNRKNKTSFGTSVTFLGDAITAGMKVEDKLIVKKRLQLVLCGAAVAGQGGVCYGSNFEATLRDKHHPAGCSPASLGLSLVDNHGGLTVESYFKSHIPIGWFTNLTALFKLNNKGTGTFSICFKSSEQLQVAIIGLMIPLLRKLIGGPQELQFGQR